MRIRSSAAVAAVVIFGVFSHGTGQAAEVPVAISAPAIPNVAVEWVHARELRDGLAVSGRLHQSAARATRSGVLITVVSGDDPARSVQVRSSAFAAGGGGATFSVVMPKRAVQAGAAVTVNLAEDR